MRAGWTDDEDLRELSELRRLLPAVLASLSPSVAAPDRTEAGATGESASFVLPAAQRAVVLLVDGLGDELLARHRAHAPFLWSLREAADGQRVAGSEVGWPSCARVGFPSTTASSIASLTTGVAAGEHGIFGYTMAMPSSDVLLNMLRWRGEPDAREVQPVPTVFERAHAGGVSPVVVGPRSFDHSGLSQAILRGATFVGVDSVPARIAAVRQALSSHPRALVYCYYGDLDATGHKAGCESVAWREQLARVDDVAQQLAAGLPAGTTLVVTGDHGMLDVDPLQRVDVDETPELTTGVRLLGGEPRARHVYAEAGAAPDVLAAWRTVIGTRAAVLGRDEAIAAGWFGEHVPAEHRSRIGDVVVAARDRFTVVSGTRAPHELVIIGVHGSVTREEQVVPVLVMPAG